jgi:hypothetical protein
LASRAEKDSEIALQNLERVLAEQAKVTGVELQDEQMAGPEETDLLAATEEARGGASAGDDSDNIIAPPPSPVIQATASNNEVDFQSSAEDSIMDLVKMKRDKLKEKHLSDDGMESMTASSATTDGGDIFIQSNIHASDDTEKACDESGKAANDDISMAIDDAVKASDDIGVGNDGLAIDNLGESNDNQDPNDGQADKKGTKRKSSARKSKADDDDVVRFEDLDDNEREQLRRAYFQHPEKNQLIL